MATMPLLAEMVLRSFTMKDTLIKSGGVVN